MALMIRLICPNLKCRAFLSVPSKARGKTVKCRQCGMLVMVPAPLAETVPTTPEENPGQQPAQAS